MERLISLMGLIILAGIAWLVSTDRKRINWRTIGLGAGLQLVLAVFLLKVPLTRDAFKWLTTKVAEFLDMAQAGATFVFGDLAVPQNFGFIFAVEVVPTIIFFSAFISILYYLGIIQILISMIAKVMRLTMGTSGAETLSCSANIFVGMTEAPLVIRPYIEAMTRSELFAVMVGGFATIAGSVLASYIAMGIPAQHLIAASVMSAPAALVIAKLMIPETEHSATRGDAQPPEIKVGENVVDAAVRGTTDGLYLSLNVLAMVIAFISLLAVADWILGGFDYLIDYRLLGGEAHTVAGVEEYRGIFPGSLRRIFGAVFAPLAFVMGVPWGEAPQVGHLLGIKICANEFVAYGELSTLLRDGALSERGRTIATYALCGFANFGSVGIIIGGISAIAPSRRPDLARLGIRAMFGGALASWMTAAIAGMLL